MKMAGNINSITHGSILLVHNPFVASQVMTYLGAIIRWLAKTHWNHCAIVIKKLGSLYVIESPYPKVKKTELHEWLRAYKREIKVININHSLRGEELTERVINKVGCRYDLSSLILFMPIFIITGNWIGRKEGKGIDKPFCFELVAWVYQFPNWFCIQPKEFIEHAKAKEITDPGQ